jgi:hypothetical protein
MLISRLACELLARLYIFLAQEIENFRLPTHNHAHAHALVVVLEKL